MLALDQRGGFARITVVAAEIRGCVHSGAGDLAADAVLRMRNRCYRLNLIEADESGRRSRAGAVRLDKGGPPARSHFAVDRIQINEVAAWNLERPIRWTTVVD